MRLIHRIPFTTSEVEHYRQLIFENLTRGLRSLLDAMVEMGLPVSPEIMVYVDMIDDSPDVGDGEPFPPEYETALRTLWDDENVRKGWNRGNEAALPEK
jgi:guanine nucleotide-binding protein subunit alpha